MRASGGTAADVRVPFFLVLFLFPCYGGANEDGPTGENAMQPVAPPTPLSRRSRLSRLDFENGLVLVIGWMVALAVTWT